MRNVLLLFFIAIPALANAQTRDVPAIIDTVVQTTAARAIIEPDTVADAEIIDLAEETKVNL